MRLIRTGMAEKSYMRGGRLLSSWEVAERKYQRKLKQKNRKKGKIRKKQ